MIKAEPSVFVPNNDEGLEMVKRYNRKYAFFCETTTIKYYTHRDCNVTQLGGKLDSKEYGIGMPMNSPYRQKINEAILYLREKGELKMMYEKWWEENITDANGQIVNCEQSDKAKDDTPELGMDNVGGVFLVLVIGIGVSLFLGSLEFVWAVRQTSIEYKVCCFNKLPILSADSYFNYSELKLFGKINRNPFHWQITPYEAFRKELLFAIRVWELHKPIAPPSEQSSLSGEASDEEKAEEINLNSISNEKRNGSHI